MELSTRTSVQTRRKTEKKSPVAGCVHILPYFPGLNTFATVVPQVHVAHLPHTPRLCHPDVLSTVAEARHDLIHLTDTNSTVTCRICSLATRNMSFNTGATRLTIIHLIKITFYLDFTHCDMTKSKVMKNNTGRCNFRER